MDKYLKSIYNDPRITISLIILFIIQFLVFLRFFIAMIDGEWHNLLKLEDLDAINIAYEKVKILMPHDWEMDAVILKHKDFMNKQSLKLPGIIVHHGFTSRKERLYDYAIPLALHGYIVLAVDAWGHGETKKNLRKGRKDDWVLSDNHGIYPNFTSILDYFCLREDVDSEKIGCVGHSMGATIIMSYGITDPRTKICIGISGIYTFTDFIKNSDNKIPFSIRWFNKTFLRIQMSFKKELAVEGRFSPKFFFEKSDIGELKKKARLIHTQDDLLVLFKHNHLKTKTHLDLPEEHVLEPRKGDHSLRGQETLITERIITWFDEVLRK